MSGSWAVPLFAAVSAEAESNRRSISPLPSGRCRRGAWDRSRISHQPTLVAITAPRRGGHHPGPPGDSLDPTNSQLNPRKNRGRPQATTATSPYPARQEPPSKEEYTMVTPGSAGDWIQALIMAAALAGLAATGRWALREEEHALSRRPGSPQLPTGLVGATEAAENIEASTSTAPR